MAVSPKVGLMAFPPVNIFTHKRDPEGTLSRLLQLVPGATVTRRGDGSWQSVQMTWKRGWLKKPLVMTANHDPDYYSDPGWQVQKDGMRNYAGSFPGADTRPDVLEYLPHLAFSFNFILEGDPEAADPRMDVIFQMAQHVDGILFLPGQFLDSFGQVLISADGQNNPEARVPVIEAANANPGQRVEAILEGFGFFDATAQSALRPNPDDHWETPEEKERRIDERVKAILEEVGQLRVPPPEPDRILRRFLMLAALARRGFMESSGESEAMRQKIIRSLKAQGAWEEAEDWESKALETPVGNLGEKLGWKLPWLCEGAAVLAWAMGLYPLPAYDQEADVSQLDEIASGVMSGDLTPTFRSQEEIKVLKKQMHAIHWRLRQFYLKPQPMDFVAFAPTAWWGAMDLSLARIQDQDLEVCGQALADAPEEDWKRTSGILEERRTAIHWLLGDSEIYSKTDTSS